MFDVSAPMLDELSVGASALGAGGGGQVWTQQVVLKDAIRHAGRPRVIGLDELDTDDLVLPIGLIGAPTAMLEVLPGPAEVERAITAAESAYGRRVVALMPLETAGANGIFPLSASAWTGLPCVDADGMGRAFPTLSTTSFALAGVPECPVILTGCSKRVVTLWGSQGPETERLVRACVREMGLVAVITAYAMSGRQAVQAAIGGSISECLRWGGVFANAHNAGFDERIAAQGGKLLFEGTVVDTARNSSGVGGSITIEHLATPARLLRVEWRTENIVAMEDGQAVATCPDIIVLTDLTTTRIRLAESISTHTPLRVCVVPSAPVWQTDSGLALAGPRAFGCPIDARRLTSEPVA